MLVATETRGVGVGLALKANQPLLLAEVQAAFASEAEHEMETLETTSPSSSTDPPQRHDILCQAIAVSHSLASLMKP